MRWWVVALVLVVVVAVACQGAAVRAAAAAAPSGPGIADTAPFETRVEHVFVQTSESEVQVPLAHLKNVVGVEVLRAWIPNREPLVHRYNNCLQYEVGGEMRVLDVPTLPPDDGAPAPREWGVTSLVAWMNGQLAGDGVACGLTRDMYVEFSAEVPFRIVVATGDRAGETVGQILGVLEDTRAEQVDGVFRARGTKRSDASGPRYIDARTQLASQHTQGVLAQIALRPDEPIVHYEPANLPVRYFTPVGVIPRLRVSMVVVDPQRTRAGLPDRPYLFHDMVWHMTLAVYTRRRVESQPTLRDI